MPTITYDFSPGDTVYVISESASSVKRGTCIHVLAKLRNDEDEALVTVVEYLVEQENGITGWVAEGDIFETYAEACTELGTRFDPPV